MDWTMAEGADYEEAVTALLKSLGADKSEIEIEDMGEHKKLFGLGGTVTRVRGKFRTDVFEDTPKKEAPRRDAPAPARASSAPARVEAPERESAPPMTAEEAAGIAEKSRGFLKEILDAMGVEAAAVTATVESGIIILNIESGAGGLLIGRGGETLEAFQTILEIYASRVNGGKAKVLVDTENYRARREEKLKEIAERAANDAIAKGKKVFLGSMKASERKLIHTILQDNPKVETRSQGDGDRRQVVVYPVR